MASKNRRQWARGEPSLGTEKSRFSFSFMVVRPLGRCMALPRGLACLMFVVALGACSSTPETDSAGDDTQTGDTQDYSAQFAEGALPESIRNGGYIDSTFINHAGDRIYFLHSIFSPSVIAGGGSSVEIIYSAVSLLQENPWE